MLRSSVSWVLFIAVSLTGCSRTATPSTVSAASTSELTSPAGPVEVTDPQQQSPLMLQIVKQQRANLDQIATWSAKGEISEEYSATHEYDPDTGKPLPPTAPQLDTMEQRVATLEFHLDQKAGKLYSVFDSTADTLVREMAEYTSEELKTRKVFPGLLRQRHLVTPEGCTLFIPHPSGTAGGTTMQRDVSSAQHQNHFSSLIDPRRFFLESGNMTYSDGIEMYAKELSKGTKLPFKFTQETIGPRTLYYFRQEFRTGDSQSESPTVVETTYDSSVACLPIRRKMTAPNGLLFEEYEWDYQRIGKIDVPKRFLFVRYVTHDLTLETLKKKVYFSREITMPEIHVNEPIPESIFTTESLEQAPAAM